MLGSNFGSFPAILRTFPSPIFFFLFLKILLCSLSCPGPQYVDHAGLKFIRNPPKLISAYYWALELKACTTTPSPFLKLSHFIHMPRSNLFRNTRFWKYQRVSLYILIHSYFKISLLDLLLIVHMYMYTRMHMYMYKHTRMHM